MIRTLDKFDKKLYGYVYLYAITISPPCNPPTVSCLKWLDIKEYDIRRLLNKFSRHYILYPEFSDTGRLHWHGLIIVHDKLALNLTRHLINKQLGWLALKPIRTFKDKLGWLMYCQKEYADICRAFKPIIYMNLKRYKTLFSATKRKHQADEEQKNNNILTQLNIKV